jgi:hypothetical protein
MRGKTPPLLHGPREKLSRSRPRSKGGDALGYLDGCDLDQLAAVKKVLGALKDEMVTINYQINDAVEAMNFLSNLASNYVALGRADVEAIYGELDKLAQERMKMPIARLIRLEQAHIILELRDEVSRRINAAG